jgi:glutamyl-tRNA synthetase
MKRLAPDELGRRLLPYLVRAGLDVPGGPSPADVAMLLRERVETLVEMADAAHYFYAPPAQNVPEKLAAAVTDAVKPALIELGEVFASLEWSREAIGGAIKEVAQRQGLKAPQIMMALRAVVTAEPQTPAIDAVLALVGRERVRERIRAQV